MTTRIIFLILFFSFLTSCGGFKDAGKVLRNEKTKTTDEFLVKKREPLSLPPDFKKLPEPRSLETEKENSKNEVSKILRIPEENNSSKKSSSVEQSIINQIGK